MRDSRIGGGSSAISEAQCVLDPMLDLSNSTCEAVAEERARQPVPGPPRVIYVAGYGRSGSTLLERILASHPHVRALGEIKDVVDVEVAEYFWDQVGDSEYWQAVRQELGYTPADFPVLDRLQKSHESLWSGWRRWLLGRRPEYDGHVSRVFQAVRIAADPATRWVVDSSKTSSVVFFRPHLLARLPGWDVRVIHLVRDGRGCLFSVLKGSNKQLEKTNGGEPVSDPPASRPDGAPRPNGSDSRSPHGGLFPALRASVGWLLANLSGFLFAATAPHRYLRIRYESLVEDPARALSRIGEFLDLDLTEQQQRIAQNEPIPAADQFSGNRVRKQERLVLKKDTQWLTGLKWWQRACFWMIAWPVPLLERIQDGRLRAEPAAGIVNRSQSSVRAEA